MLLPTLLAACVLCASPVPGGDVDHPADDREVFRRLERATTALAERGAGALGRAERLEQCRRTRADAVRLAVRAGAGAPLDGAEAYRRGARAAVLIGSAYKCGKCAKWHSSTASGFAVTADGVIATNHHVAAGEAPEAMGVMTADGRFFPVLEVLAADKAHDVALLRVEADDLAFLPLREDAPAGSPIRCYSHPAYGFGFLGDGVIARYARNHGSDGRATVLMQITADFAQGSSGGPVIDEFGNAVGMVMSTSAVFTTPQATPAAAKAPAPTPAGHQQMVRHNCATARAILDLARSR